MVTAIGADGAGPSHLNETSGAVLGEADIAVAYQPRFPPFVDGED